MTITIDSNFLGGGLGSLKFAGEKDIYFAAPLDGSPLSLWFYFRIRGAKGRHLRLHQIELDSVLEFDRSQGVLPVVREGVAGPWQRLSPGEVSFCTKPRTFNFDLFPQSNETYVAFCYPYLLSDFLEFVKGLAPQELIADETIGETAEGRSYPLYLIGNRKGAKKMVVLTARQHAGEVSGSFVLEGIMARLLDSAELRNNLVLAVFPFVDLDGVETGRYGKSRPPVDFNVDWSYDPLRPEIRLIQKKIEELTNSYEYVFFGDLHAPQPGAPSFLVPLRKSILGAKQWEDFWSFAKKFAELTDAISPCRLEDHQIESLNWGGQTYQANCPHYQWARYGVASTILEIAYHRDSNGNYSTPERWREMGARFLNAIYEHYVLGNKTKLGKNELPPPYVYGSGWETLSIPENVIVQGEPDKLTLESKGKKTGSFWFGQRSPRPLRKDPQTVELNLSYEGQQALLLNVTAYYLKNKVAYRDIDEWHLQILPGEQRLQFNLEGFPSEASHVKFALQGVGLAGKLELEFV